MSTVSKTVLHPVIAGVTERIRARSIASRAAYLEKCQSMRRKGTQRGQLSCSNLAHGFAACSGEDKDRIRLEEAANIAIVSAYNDMLSAHKPLEHFPDLIREAVSELGCTAQFAGGTPAMCDGVTQGAEGMELSLFSRDTIAMSTAIALSHNMFDAVLCLGVCDKIVPGLLIGALSFGHLPMIMVPAGPMSTGLSNDEKARIRQLYAEGKATRDELLASEMGLDISKAKRIGLLHDIGKAMSEEVEGPHAIVGADFLKRNKEPEDVVNGVASHHGEVPYDFIWGILVSAADAISASRPGARSETMTSYLQRFRNLERIGASFDGVDKCYAVQAGREIRIIVNPKKISDEESYDLARQVARKIEEELQYPGQIRVTMVRENRFVEYAK